MKRATLSLLPILAPALSAALSACGGEGGTLRDEVALRKDALLGVKAYVAGHLAHLSAASAGIQSAAPMPDADGWSGASEPDAMGRMKQSWKDARSAYEHVEGAIAVLFPDLDVYTDERYDGFLEEGGDDDLFDDQGVVGIHAVERILWADQQPPEVVEFERALSGYKPAAFPATLQEATDFRTKLVGRLMRDTKTMEDEFAPLALDLGAAYRGVVGSIREQVEKVSLASTGEAESRYANYTLADMRANLEGGREIFTRFEAWLSTKDGGAELADRIVAAFDALQAEYDALPGDGLPPVPAGWNPKAATPEHLATPYGKLYTLVDEASDPKKEGSLVALMTEGARLIGIPEIPE